MKISYVLYPVFVVLLSVCLLAIFRLNKARIQSDKLSENYFVNSELFGLLKWNIGKHYSFENTAINDFEITDKENNVLSFFDLISAGSSYYKLVFYFSSKNCGSCVESEMSNIQAFTHRIGESNIIILGQFQSIRQLRAFLTARKIDIPVYYVESNPFGILYEENLPFSFVVNKNMTAELVFIPIKEILSYSEMYYTTVYERFFNNNFTP